MTVKDYLEQYRTLDAEIEAEIEQVERLRLLVTRASAGYNSGGLNPMPYDKVGELTTQIVDLENKVNGKIEKLLALRMEIKGHIALIPDAKVRVVIDLHYISGQSFGEIAKREARDIRTIFRRHKEGVKFLEKNIKMSLNVTEFQ